MSEYGETADEDPPRAAIQWRRLDPHLWAGRCKDRPVGTIEHGRGFVFVDLDGVRHAGYATLEAAKHAASGRIRLPLAEPVRSGRPARRAPRKGLVIAVAVIVVVIVGSYLCLRYLQFG